MRQTCGDRQRGPYFNDLPEQAHGDDPQGEPHTSARTAGVKRQYANEQDRHDRTNAARLFFNDWRLATLARLVRAFERENIL